MAGCTFTVFTPTFNRAHTLHRVYESLAAQTCHPLEWLVVDDGSTDGTAELIRRWTAEAPFSIRCLQQPHRGKHFAFNAGVAAARGELFLPIDSDDACVPTALERFLHHWSQIPEAVRHRFTGVTALGADPLGRVKGARFPTDVIDSDSNEILYRHGVTGDKWGFHRTEVLRRHPFPELPGTSFVPEGIVWSAIARSYKTRFVNEVLLTIWSSEASEGQLSTSRLSMSFAAALALWHRSILNNDLRWFRVAPGRLLTSAANYSRFSFDSGTGFREQRRRLGRAAQLLWAFALPAGAALSLRDRAHAIARARP